MIMYVIDVFGDIGPRYGFVSATVLYYCNYHWHVSIYLLDVICKKVGLPKHSGLDQLLHLRNINPNHSLSVLS